MRHVTPDGKVWVLATNLPLVDFPAEVFGDLYHQRWRIEESYKRLKHRAKIESVSGLTQHAVLIDLYAKVLADNLNALVCMAASDDVDMGPPVADTVIGPMRVRVCSESCPDW